MTKILTVVALTSLAIGCGSASPAGTTGTGGGTGTTGGGTSGTTSGTSGTSITPFLGMGNCTYSGTYTLTGTTTVKNSPAYTSSATVVAGTTTDLEITQLQGCTETLNVTSTDVATFSPTEQSCSFTDPINGNMQTNVRTGTLSVTGSTETLVESGTFSGTTPASVAYAGSYQGTWTCIGD